MFFDRGRMGGGRITGPTTRWDGSGAGMPVGMEGMQRRNPFDFARFGQNLFSQYGPRAGQDEMRPAVMPQGWQEGQEPPMDGQQRWAQPFGWSRYRGM